MVDWISLSQTAGTGNATITVSASSYSELLQRSTSLVISAGDKSSTVNILQRYNSNFSVRPSSIVFRYTGGTTQIMIDCDSTWSLSAPNWITASHSYGSGSSIVNLTAQINNSNERSGSVVVTSDGNQRTVSVLQYSENEQVEEITISPSAVTFESSGESKTIRITSDGNWTLTTPEWLSATQTSGGAGTFTVGLTSTPNTGDTLSGYVSASTNSSSASCSVVQEGHYVYPHADSDVDNFTGDSSGGEYNVGIDSNVAWSAFTTAFWIMIDPTSGNGGYNIIKITLAENESVADRSGQIIIRDIATNETLDVITINQPAKAAVNDYLTIIFTGNTQNTYYVYNSSSEELESVTSNSDSYKKLSVTTPYDISPIPSQDIEYNKNGNGWQSVTIPRLRSGDSYTITSVEDGDVIKLRAVKSWPYNFVFNLKAVVQGNPKSMIYGDNYSDTESVDNAYVSMFSCCPVISSKGILFNDVLARRNSYNRMFSGCSMMVDFPSLPATTLSEGCYSNMFYACKSLTSAPYLPATNFGYIIDNDADMGNLCYMSMFARCTGLTIAPNLPAANFGNYSGVCYYMFEECSSLVVAPEIKKTTMYDYCYKGMFCKCYSLKRAPELPATTLYKGCYEEMFRDCTSLTESPILSAEYIPEDGYRFMFSGCTNLSKITCYAVDIGLNATSMWTAYVAEEGLFIKSASATSWVDGAHGIPYDWVVQNA